MLRSPVQAQTSALFFLQCILQHCCWIEACVSISHSSDLLMCTQSLSLVLIVHKAYTVMRDINLLHYFNYTLTLLHSRSSFSSKERISAGHGSKSTSSYAGTGSIFRAAWCGQQRPSQPSAPSDNRECTYRYLGHDWHCSQLGRCHFQPRQHPSPI